MHTKGYFLSFIATLSLVACSQSDTQTISNKAQENFGEDDQYIVVLKKKLTPTSTAKAQLRAVKVKVMSLAEKHSLAAPSKIFTSAIRGGVYNLTPAQVEALETDPDVAYVEKDYIVSINSATWGLDRLDQVSLPLNQTYNFPTGGAVVNAYIIDTGILTTHADFQGRAFSGSDFVDKDSDATDCNGHGTHVAGTIGSATYGVVKNAKLYGVRVLDCSGSGRYSDVISGIEWVTTHHVKPAVANLSLGGPVSQAIDDAVRASIQAGVTYAVAAGNSNTDACSTSPSRVAEALTVGSTTSTDGRSSFSNYGRCVDVFAPGSDITSLWYTSNSATNTISGTSMASPHVAGVAALYLAGHPDATPAQVATALVVGATSGAVLNVGTGSPNKLLNTAFANLDTGGGGGGGDTPEPVGDGRLASGVPLTDLSGAKNSAEFYTIEVPENSTLLTVELSGGSGDADLYLRYGEAPTASVYDCRPYASGNLETCTQVNPRAGTWYVMLNAYQAYSGVSVKATVTKSAAACLTCVTYTGALSGRGAYMYQPTSGTYFHAGGLQELLLEGPEGTDFDLYLYKQNGTAWPQVASSTSIKSLEQIKYSGTAGVYRIKVYSYSGSGAYKLSIK